MNKKKYLNNYRSFGVGVVVVVVGIIGIRLAPFVLSNQRDLEMDKLFSESENSQESGVFHGKLVQAELVGSERGRQILGTSDELEKKRIEVDLTAQKLYAYEGDKMVAEFMVSTGKWGRTPTGKFRIWSKFEKTKMEGGNPALHTYYYLPNVPYTMFFYNEEIPQARGYGIHGTYWHSNYGETMSHGCINMRTRDVEKLFYWAGPNMEGKSSQRASTENPGTEIVIYK